MKYIAGLGEEIGLIYIDMRLKGGQWLPVSEAIGPTAMLTYNRHPEGRQQSILILNMSNRKVGCILRGCIEGV